MRETDPEYMTDVSITVLAGERTDEICSMLRGLLYSNGNSSGQATKNREFLGGTVISFGAGPKARDFMTAVKALFSKSARARILINLQG